MGINDNGKWENLQFFDRFTCIPAEKEGIHATQLYRKKFLRRLPENTIKLNKSNGIEKILTTVMTRNVADKSTDNTKPHSLCFYHNIIVKENVFLKRDLKKALCNKLTASANSIVWTLIDNGKLANQIARLVAMVVKKNNFYKINHFNSLNHELTSNVALRSSI